MSTPERQASETVIAYHQRTKHHLYAYAAGPETLDWTSQPNPFREFAGSPRVELPLNANALTTPFAHLYAPPGKITPQPLSLESLGALLELSFGLSAWKEYGPDRWALRCNPSSGNLHPTEAYVLCQRIPGLHDGVYHYVSRDHVLEQRARALQLAQPDGGNGAWIALSSVHWREAWKYGERAFRYCQLDVGHALGAIRYAAAALGWQAKLVDHHDTKEITHLLGLDRDVDYGGAEREDADVLLALLPPPSAGEINAAPFPGDATRHIWQGHANVLDPHPMYHWPVIGEVANATSSGLGPIAAETAASIPALTPTCDAIATAIIKHRRSAQQFDGKYRMSAVNFFHLLDCLLPRPTTPWDVWSYAARVHPILFVHRVEGVEPGLYALPRREEAKVALQAAMKTDFLWSRVDNCPAHIPLYKLALADCTRLAGTLFCHQAIAANSSFALGMLAEFEPIVRDAPWRYCQLHWEAGLLGHVLYLEAEAMGLRGTGIGCYFDDAFHELLGLHDNNFQSLYHFTVGRALVDNRITTLPPYPARAALTTENLE